VVGAVVTRNDEYARLGLHRSLLSVPEPPAEAGGSVVPSNLIG